ncbi:universal stress protein [bacterium]|nr:universal stress protein [bacterium]
MTNQHKILFPIDFSECSSPLVADVLDFASKFQSEIHLVYVVRTFAYYATINIYPTYIQSIEDAVMAGSKKSMEDFKNAHFANYSKLEHSILYGDASEEIVRYAKVHTIDLIIMGTHGRKALEKLLMGSVAQRVIQSSPIPVLTINPYLREKRSE